MGFRLRLLEAGSMVLRRYAAAFLVLLLLACAGCGEDEKVVPEQLILHGDTCRAVALATPLALQINVVGKPVGGKDSVPVASAAVRYVLIKSPAGVTPLITPDAPRTDAGGRSTASLTGLNKPGIYRVRIDLPEYSTVAPLTITILGGIRLGGDAQDASIGNVLNKPMTLIAESAPGKPMSGVRFGLDLRRAPQGTRLMQAFVVTDDSGEAQFEVKLGGKQGAGSIGIRVLTEPWDGVSDTPDLKASFFAIDYWGVAIAVLGGLAIFIYGMRMMSDGLALIASNRLRSLLHFLTRNRFVAVLMGTVVTGFIQSSSACTVMVIGFVNAGLMRLEQAIGVIMGANIGTTVTAQLLSFNIGAIALPAIALGVFITLVAKRKGILFGAQILIGFGLLFMGMQMMSAPMKELSGSATILDFFKGFSCAPVDGGVIPLAGFLKAVAIGTLLTLVIQSSSAAVGILLTLSGAGLIDVYTAFGILLGDNIGTTVTAVLAAIGSNKTAKRSACAHVSFNVFGTFVMVALLYVPWNGHPAFMQLVADFTPGDSFAGENLPRYLANAHTLFNVACTCLLIWFVTPLAWFTRLIFPGEEGVGEAQELRTLDPHLLATPALAISQAWSEIGLMLEKGRNAITPSSRAIFSDPSENLDVLSEVVHSLEKELDLRQGGVNEYLSNISRSALNEEQSYLLPKLLHAVNDAERVSDYAVQLIRLAKRAHKRGLVFSEAAHAEITQMNECLEQLFTSCHKRLEADGGLRQSSPAERAENTARANAAARHLKKLAGDFRKEHILRQEQGLCELHAGVIYLELLQILNRVGGHLHNIMEATSSERLK